ncbi:conserved exported hypothetical protein [Candidatus Sulfopaludibacter sp. SbA3]|nr:conserved exported hypothetical protein [Candidatus Sulfopaludibacter sp. SbA3]
MPKYSRSRMRQRGSIMIFVLVALPMMLIPLVGLAIDATMLRIVQARLSAAVDGAALGTGRLLGTSADPSSISKEFVKASFQTGGSGFWGASNLQIYPTYTPGIIATADVPLLFSRIFGQQTATVSAAGTATRTDSRIELVIDRSGSMTAVQSDGNTALADALNDAVQFVQSWNPGADEVGLIVFDGTSYVAYPNYAPGTYSLTPTASGGPDTSFNTVVSPATVGPVVGLLQSTAANNGATNTSEALWLAYIELQKAHLRDIAGGNTDTRINAIVFMTDGLPQSVTIYPNNVFSYPANYFMATSGSSCTNLYNAATKPNPAAINGFMVVPAQWNPGGATTFTSSTPLSAGTGEGIYLNSYSDSTSAHTASWWVSTGAGQRMALSPANDAGCTGLFGTTGSDLAKIPSVDAYGNTMSGNAYTNSVFVKSSGTVSASNNPILASGHTFNQNAVYSGIDWIQAQWNASVSAGQRIRQDVNLSNRAGDKKMPIYIYCIGYLGTSGADQAMLASIANDPALSYNYDSTTPAGKYYPASDPVALHNAFETVAATILRLSK